MTAEMSSAVPLTQAVTSGDANAVSAALAHGADVNERNNGGQTALILAVIFGHTNLVQLLVNAGANPRLRDNLGLDAIEWAQRRGLTEALQILNNSNSAPPPPVRRDRVEEALPAPETPVDRDEKSRKWLAGVKQRIQEREKARLQSPEPPPQITPTPLPAPPSEPVREVVREPVRESIESVREVVRVPVHEPVRESIERVHEIVPETVSVPGSVPVDAAPKTSSTRKRCPKCNTIYNSDLLAYCAHHVVPLVDADEPMFVPPPSTSITATPLLWTFILVTVSLAVFTGYLITSQLSRVVIPDTPTATTTQQPQGMLKGAPAAAGELNGKAVQLPQAECPIFENDARPANAALTVNVHVKLDKSGKVYWARAEGGDEPLRRAATEAATKSTFSPEKLRGRETQGTITYTFEPQETH